MCVVGGEGGRTGGGRGGGVVWCRCKEREKLRCRCLRYFIARDQVGFLRQ